MMKARAAIACALLVLLQACSTRFSGQREPDWDRDGVDAKPVQREQPVVLPAFPEDSDLAEFAVGPSGSHRFFVDTRTVDIGSDGVVRYALVVKTAGGASNATYEGIRCATYEKRVYAVGHPQRKWIEARRSVWEPIQTGRANEHQVVLYKDYFCPDRTIVPDRTTLLRAFSRRIYFDTQR